MRLCCVTAVRGDCERLEKRVTDVTDFAKTFQSALRVLHLKLLTHTGHVVSSAPRVDLVKWLVCVIATKLEL